MSNADQHHQQKHQHNRQKQPAAVPGAVVRLRDTTDSCEEDYDADETTVLIKGQKSNKKAERTPLLAAQAHHSAAVSGSSMLTPLSDENLAAPAPRSQRTQTTESIQSDEEIHRICHEQYGSTTGADFAACLVEAIRAINNGIYPERIAQGSSGSYFVKDLQGDKIGVFKPKNEEPYGMLNPKWIKWLHKVFFPCCFGRSCLVPNQGYLSEAGASLIDQKLGLGVVPRTAVVSLAAPTFNYGRIDRAMSRTKQQIRHRLPDLGRHFKRVGLPPKRGSFQQFVHGYKDASYWLRQWDLHPELELPDPTQLDFQLQFVRLVILDYIIRNTDRGNDNWLIRYEPASVVNIEDGENQPPPISNKGDGLKRVDTFERLKRELGKEPAKFADEDGKLIDIHGPETLSTAKQKQQNVESDKEECEAWEDVAMPRVRIAAIDNGLAFPFKHPDQWRAYPYRWASLSMAQQPFSKETVQKILPLIENTDFVRELCNDLRNIFKTDKGFDKRTFGKQLNVLRGQMFNLREALRTRKTPAQLVQMTPQYMIERKKKKRKKKDARKTTANTYPGSSTTVVSVMAPTPTTVTEQPKAQQIQSASSCPTVATQTIVDIDGGAGVDAGTGTVSAAVSTTVHQQDDSTLSEQLPGTSATITVSSIVGLAPVLTEDELDDPKSWHNTFEQKVQTKSPFFAMW